MSESSGSWSSLYSLWAHGGLTRALLRDSARPVDVEDYFTRLDSLGSPWSPGSSSLLPLSDPAPWDALGMPSVV